MKSDQQNAPTVQSNPSLVPKSPTTVLKSLSSVPRSPKLEPRDPTSVPKGLVQPVTSFLQDARDEEEAKEVEDRKTAVKVEPENEDDGSRRSIRMLDK